MVYLAAAQFVLIIGLIWLLDRNRNREVEAIRVQSDQHALERANSLDRLSGLCDLLAARSREPHPDLRELTGIVDRLCQRVQAPEQAVVEHSMSQPLPPMPQPALPDDDKAWWEAQGFAAAPSKEELAEAYEVQ